MMILRLFGCLLAIGIGTYAAIVDDFRIVLVAMSVIVAIGVLLGAVVLVARYL